MKNRIASLFLVFALLMSLCNFAVARDNRINVQSGGAERFTDVPTSHWAYGYIDKVVGSGLFNGKTPTTFEPSSAMTRSQFVMVMARMEGRSDLEGVETQTIFPDVTTTRRAAGPIKWATDEGFVNGFGDGTFKPDSPITRGQFAALIHRYIVAKRYVNLHPVDPEPAQFTDAASVSSAFTEDVEYARILGLLTGYSDGTVRAGNPITRAAIAAILARFLDLVTESGYTPLLDGPVIDGGDSGDSGDSGDTGGSTDVSTEYDEVKLTVSGSTHGTTKLTITRDGKTVDPDDVQEGDLVTVTHEPDSGYGVSVRVRDAKNKTVKKTTNNKTYTTTFKVPSTNLPVTVTVTYSKSGSGGGGGGGGGSSGGGGGGGTIYPPTPTTQNYTLILQATVTAAEGEAAHGTVFLSDEPPKADTELPESLNASQKAKFPTVSATQVPTFTAYAIFVADDGYELKEENVTVNPASAWNKTPAAVTLVTLTAGGQRLYYVTLTAPGVVDSAKTDADVTVTATFTQIGGNVNPPTPANKFTWTVNANVTGGYVAISKTPFTDAQKQAVLTANGTVSDSLTDLLTKDAQDADTVNKFYVAVSPDMRHVAADPNLAPTAANAKVTVTLTDTLLDNTLYLYEVTITGIDANVTTTLNGSFVKAEGADDIDYNVTVTARYLDANGAEITAPADALAPESDKDTAKKDATVTVTAPVPDGYFVDSVTVNGANVPADDQASTPTVVKYPFTMPDGDAVVVVTYKALPAEEPLNFTVNVTFADGGEGSVALNVAGKEYMFSSDGEKTKTFSMLPSEYNAQYPNGIPAYLVSTIPATAKGYKFDGITAPAGFANTTATSPNTSLTDTNTTLNVTVKFVKEYSYAYNLTVIGDGKATVRLDNETNSSDVKTSNSIIRNSSNVTLTVTSVEAGPTSKAVDDSFRVLINDESRKVNEAYSMTPGTVEIVVAFLPKEATIVPFTVQLVGDGKVAVRAENGPFVVGNTAPSEDALNASSTRTAEVSDTNAASRTLTAYAWSGTIITLTPDLGENVVIQSIEVDGQNQVRDELPSNGFSYTLVDTTKAEYASRNNEMIVTTATFGGYSLLVQAPYKGELESGDVGLHSFSKVESKSGANDPAKTVTLEDVLYSLNNGQSLTYLGENSFTEVNNIKNNIAATLGMFPKIVQLYLYDGGKTKSAEQLEKRINKGVEASITGNIGNMINSQKETMIDSAEGTIKQTLAANLTNVNVQIPSDLATTMKPEIVQQILNSDATPDAIKRAYAAQQITDANFNVSLTATLLKLESDETSANVTDQARAKGKSLQAQIERKLVKEYLRDPAHVDIVVGSEQASAANMGLTPQVKLETPVLSSGVLTVPVSASAAVANPPTLKQEPSFTDFMTKDNGLDLDVWVVAKVTVSVTMPGATAPTSLLTNEEIFKQVTLDATQVQTIKTQLNVVQSTLANAWTQEWNKLTSDDSGIPMRDENGNSVLNIALGDVITEDMIVRIIKGTEDGTEEGLLTPVLNRIAVDSLGDATATRSKVLSIYDDLMFFKPNGDKLDALQLKTKSGNQADYKSLLTASGNKLNLTLDMNSFFKDVSGGTLDQTSFELLVDLMIGLRDGVATDIRNTTGQNPQVAISSMILGQLSNNKRVVTVTKWGKPVSSTRMTATEKKELADLLAELIMQEDITTKTLHDAWKNFEAKGYSSIEFKNVGLPGGDIGNALINSGYGFSATTPLVGVKLERTLSGN